MIEEILWADDIINPIIYNYIILLKNDNVIIFITTNSSPSNEWNEKLLNRLKNLIKNENLMIKVVEKLPPLNSLGAYVGWKLSRVLDLDEANNWSRLPDPIRKMVFDSFKQLEMEMAK
ncbi:hypothetical protein QS257_17505 [Terrilactibacillus sp. S3-3]|nr:hypothetical protein QS257_17505 [Terrilactibacillus sp. S3-3]